MADLNSHDFLREIDELLLDDKIQEPANEEKNPQTRGNGTPNIETLRAALASHEDAEVIRKLCSANKVPDELRADVWKECLNVFRKPDTMGHFQGPLDCENQTLIHSQCLEQAARLDVEESERQHLATEMELVLTYYCKTRNVPYTQDCGWAELLLPFVSLGLSRRDLFNAFYALTVKYLPRDCKAGGQPFHLFRLLLLYHDPELCSLLDTKQLSPESYLQEWIRGLYVSKCKLPVVRAIWDHYLMERDPFLIFFLALVMVVNSKELVLGSSCTMVSGSSSTSHQELVSETSSTMASGSSSTVVSSSTSHQKLCRALSAVPSQLNVDDIDDLFSLAQYYASRTPQSFRKDYHSLMFGSGRGTTSTRSIATDVFHALCLPISIQEVVGSREAGDIHYVIVDCRPVEQFSCGHLPNAHNLDSNLLLYSPSDFEVSLQRLCSRVKDLNGEGGEHMCFLGSGREQEDQNMNLVVAKFLHKSIPHISLARGGFLELKSILGVRIAECLEDYDQLQCDQFYLDTTYCSTVPSDASDSETESSSSLYNQKLHSKGAKLYTALSAGFKERSQRFKTRLGSMWYSSEQKPPQAKHVSSADPPSKRYRNHGDVFVIADEDEENEEASTEDGKGQMVNISLYTAASDLYYNCPCNEMVESELYCSHLLLTKDSIVVLRELSDRVGWAVVKHRHKIQSVLKITAKKKHPDIITFTFGHGSGQSAVPTHQIRFQMPNPQKATAAIKAHISRVQGCSG